MPTLGFTYPSLHYGFPMLAFMLLLFCAFTVVCLLFACKFSATIKSVLYGTLSRRVLAWVERHRLSLRVCSILFVPLWFAGAYFSIGFGTSTPDYIQLTRGTFYVLYWPSFWGIGPWWQKDWDFFCVYRPNPTLWTDFDVATDGAGIGIPIWFVGCCLFMFTFVPRLARRIIDRTNLTPGRCRNCGYDLGGLRSPICPECGQESQRQR